jgi:hypothetical protein
MAKLADAAVYLTPLDNIRSARKPLGFVPVRVQVPLPVPHIFAD